MDIEGYSIYDNAIHVDLTHPRIEDRPSKIIVSLMDTRAADNITITYDYERDGWVVSRDILDQLDDIMASKTVAHAEVAFVPAWSSVDDYEGDK